MDRRTSLKGCTVAAAAVASYQAVGYQTRAAHANQAEKQPQLTAELASSFTRPVFIATWPFGKAACERSRAVLKNSGSMRDAVEKGINVTELDESNSSVGYGGLPNADGIVQLDASFMDGELQKAGAVAAMENFANPISVARRVMESTKHVLLAGKDAEAFARSNGFQPKELLTESAKTAWERWKKTQALGEAAEKSHDTIALIGVNADGHVVGGCSTSGLAYKLPGRVGDSPIIGAGLYVDGKVGAAGATGVGENVMRYCASFLIVEFMRQGMEPSEACEAAVRRIIEGEQRPAEELSVNFVAINKQGVVGAAGTDASFRCAIVDQENSLVAQPTRVS